MVATYCTTSDAARLAGLLIASLPDNVTEANITSHIEDSEKVIDRICNTTFTSTAITEYYDGNDKNEMYLRHYPIVSVTSLTIQGTSIDVTNDLYVYTGMEGGGCIKLATDADVTTFQSTYPRGIVVAYNYGTSTVPGIIKKATANLAARMLLTQQVGGTYDDITSFTIPEFTASLGEPWTQIRETMQKLKDEWDNLIFPYLPRAPAV